MKNVPVVFLPALETAANQPLNWGKMLKNLKFPNCR